MRAKVQMTIWYLRWLHAYMFVNVYAYFDDIKRHPPRWQFVCSGEAHLLGETYATFQAQEGVVSVAQPSVALHFCLDSGNDHIFCKVEVRESDTAEREHGHTIARQQPSRRLSELVPFSRRIFAAVLRLV